MLVWLAKPGPSNQFSIVVSLLRCHSGIFMCLKPNTPWGGVLIGDSLFNTLRVDTFNLKQSLIPSIPARERVPVRDCDKISRPGFTCNFLPLQENWKRNSVLLFFLTSRQSGLLSLFSLLSWPSNSENYKEVFVEERHHYV